MKQLEIYKRIKKLRRDQLKLTQDEFSKRIKISRSNLASIEIGRISVTDRVINDICLAFKVNEEWLRNGQGDVFSDSKSVVINQLSEEYHLNELETDILKSYINLPPKQRDIIGEYIKFVATNYAQQTKEKE